MTAADRAPRLVRIGMTGLFGYELIALWSDLPTITKIARENPAVAVGILGTLAVHFHPAGIL